MTFDDICAAIKADADLLARLHRPGSRGAALEEVAARFGGEVHHTGGNIWVALIPVGQHEVVGVSDELCMLYRSATQTDPYEIFWEPDSGDQEKIVSLIEGVAENEDSH